MIKKLKKLIKKIIIYIKIIFKLLLFYISKLIPKNKNLWVFGAWFGDNYSDNSKYFYEFVINNDKNIRCVWLTRNKDTFNFLKREGKEVYFINSWKAYWILSRSYIGFVCTGYNDITDLILPKVIINLWHGCPLKKIVYDDIYHPIIKKTKFFIPINRILPYIKYPDDYDFLIASSEEEAKNLSSAFKKNIKDIWITGLPRNDELVKNHNFKNYYFKVIYMPTHRNEKEQDIYKKFILKDIQYLNDELKKLDIYLDIKLHFYHNKDKEKIRYSNINFLDKIDIYNEIYKYNVLITDYSSVFFDYLLLDRPIIFTPFDYNEYLKNNREFYYDYDKITPGPKCKNWNEVIEWIKKFKENLNLYSEERKKIRDRFHRYQDGKNCERVYKNVLRILKD